MALISISENKASKDKDYEDVVMVSRLDTLQVTTPSNTANANTTKRTFTKNSVVKYLSFNNYYNTANLTSYSVSGNTISITGSSGYGVGIVCNDNVKPNTTYKVEFTSTGKCPATQSIGIYTQDGTFVNLFTIASGQLFTTPSEAYYILIIVTVGGGGTGLSGTFTLQSGVVSA